MTIFSIFLLGLALFLFITGVVFLFRKSPQKRQSPTTLKVGWLQLSTQKPYYIFFGLAVICILLAAYTDTKQANQQKIPEPYPDTTTRKKSEEEPATITGTVIYGTSQPVPGAKVVMEGFGKVIADSNGQFTFHCTGQQFPKSFNVTSSHHKYGIVQTVTTINTCGDHFNLYFDNEKNDQ